MSTSVSNPYTFNIQRDASINASINSIKYPLTITFTAKRFQTPNHEIAYGFVGIGYTCTDNTDANITNFFKAFYIIPEYENNSENISNLKVVMTVGFIPKEENYPDRDFVVTLGDASTAVAFLNADSVKQEIGGYTFSASANDTESQYSQYIAWNILAAVVSRIKSAISDGTDLPEITLYVIPIVGSNESSTTNVTSKE